MIEKLLKVLNYSRFVPTEIKDNLILVDSRNVSRNKALDYLSANPDMTLSLKVPKDVMVFKINKCKSSIVEDIEDKEHIIKKLVKIIKAKEEKSIIIKDNKDNYYFITSANNSIYKGENTTKNGNVSFSLIDDIDIIAYGESSYIEMPFRNEDHILHVGVTKLSELEEPNDLLVCPRDKFFVGSNIIEWKNIYNDILYRLNPHTEKENRIFLLNQYVEYLISSGTSMQTISECLAFVGLEVFKESIKEDEFNKVIEHAEKTMKKDNSMFISSVIENMASAMEKNRYMKNSFEIERAVLTYIDTCIPNAFKYREYVYIRDGKKYKKYTDSEFNTFLTSNIESYSKMCLTNSKFIHLVSDCFNRRKTITKEEFKEMEVRDDVITFPNGRYDFKEKRFSYIDIEREKIDTIQIETKYIRNKDAIMYNECKKYIMGLADDNLNTYDAIKGLLGSILLKDPRKYKRIFILVSYSVNGGKDKFLEFLEDLMGEAFGTTSQIKLNHSDFTNLENTLVAYAGHIKKDTSSAYDNLLSLSLGQKLKLTKKKNEFMRMPATLIFTANRQVDIALDYENSLKKNIQYIDFMRDFASYKTNEYDFNPILLENKTFKEHFLLFMIECANEVLEKGIKEYYLIQEDTFMFVKRDPNKSIESFLDIFEDPKEIIGFRPDIIYNAYFNFCNHNNIMHAPKKQFEHHLETNHNIIKKEIVTNFHLQKIAGYFFIGKEWSHRIKKMDKSILQTKINRETYWNTLSSQYPEMLGVDNESERTYGIYDEEESYD